MREQRLGHFRCDNLEGGENKYKFLVFNEAQVKLFITKLEVGTSRRRPDCKCTCHHHAPLAPLDFFCILCTNQLDQNKTEFQSHKLF